MSAAIARPTCEQFAYSPPDAAATAAWLSMHAAAPLHVPQLLAQFAVMNATFFVHSPIAAQPAHDGALAAASAHGAVGAIVELDAGGAAPGDGVTIPGGRGGPTGPGVGGAAIGVGVLTAAVAVSAVDGATVRSPHAVRTCSSTSFAGIVVFQ